MHDRVQAWPALRRGSITNGEACDDGANNGAPRAVQHPLPAQVRDHAGPGETCDDGNGAPANAALATLATTLVAAQVRQWRARIGEQCDEAFNDGSYGTAPDCT